MAKVTEMPTKKTLSKKAMAELEAAKKSTTKMFNPYAGMWILGSTKPLRVTAKTSKSVTLEYGGVSMGKHFGEMHEHKPS